MSTGKYTLIIFSAKRSPWRKSSENYVNKSLYKISYYFSLNVYILEYITNQFSRKFEKTILRLVAELKIPELPKF